MGKKITFCTYDAPLFHGPNTWLKRLLPDLQKNNFSIQVLVFFEGNLQQCETYKYFIDLGYDVRSHFFQSMAEDKIRWILKTLSEDPPDIFVPNMLVHAYYAAGWLKKAGISTIGLIHSDDEFYQGIIEEFVIGKEEFNTTAVVSCSKYLHAKVNSVVKKNKITKCIPYGVPTNKIPQASFDSKTIKLIYAGRLSEKQKRISEVVKAMCKASNEIDGVEGVIFGSGENEKVENLIKKHSANNKVIFGGSVPNSDIFKVLSTSNVFVLLSDYEGLSQSLLEAMACGLVPICSDMKSGIPELIQNYKTGIIVKNQSDFVASVKNLQNNPDLCKRISQNAKTKAAEYSIDLCSSAWIALLNDLNINEFSKKKIEIPLQILLPKPNRHLKKEDFRPQQPLNLFIKRVRESVRIITKKTFGSIK